MNPMNETDPGNLPEGTRGTFAGVDLIVNAGMWVTYQHAERLPLGFVAMVEKVPEPATDTEILEWIMSELCYVGDDGATLQSYGTGVSEKIPENMIDRLYEFSEESTEAQEIMRGWP